MKYTYVCRSILEAKSVWWTPWEWQGGELPGEEAPQTPRVVVSNIKKEISEVRLEGKELGRKIQGEDAVDLGFQTPGDWY